MKTVSVIVPVYNAEKYIDKNIKSILNQTYQNLEVIVINDGSTDKTLDILKKYSYDDRLKIINQKNHGVSHARNIGIDFSTGMYIYFVDSDDYLSECTIEILMSNINRYNADISCCGHLLERPQGNIAIYGTNKLLIMNKEEAILELLKGDKIEPGVWSKLYKKSVLEDLKFDESIKINEDYLFNMYAFNNANTIVFEDKPLYHYVLHSNSATTSTINLFKVKDCMYAAEQLDDKFPSKSKLVKNKIKEKKFLSYLGYYNEIIDDNSTASRMLKKSIRKKIINNKCEYRLLKLDLKSIFFYYGILYCPRTYKYLFLFLKKIKKDNRVYKIDNI